MRLIQATVRSRTDNGVSKWHLDVEATPVGGVLLGALVAWMGWKGLKLISRRLWLPVGAGVAVLALRRMARSNKEPEDYQEEE
ncbi:MAG: hypothetical protein HPY54_00495 [Chthonomonadetes bacterium]|nr:hypothetical protein [Chthonomonadetes bacterium]